MMFIASAVHHMHERTVEKKQDFCNNSVLGEQHGDGQAVAAQLISCVGVQHRNVLTLLYTLFVSVQVNQTTCIYPQVYPTALRNSIIN